MLGIIVEKTGLVPNRISGLDIDFAPEHRVFLVLILLGAVVYFWISFLVYASSDFSKHQLSLRNAGLRQRAMENRDQLFAAIGAPTQDSGSDIELRKAAATAALEKTLDTAMQRYLKPYWQIATPLGWIRGILEFAFPLIIGGYTIYLLWQLACAI
ncbi:MAG: hypothetical protein A3H91_15105 [Gammaproteobacteria bacterium RIFCSPLOWO2_02_FULL_61_13]|nr:MAG: hypothetical protein A3H91_15105 [Gammaproteobacteria bacterium RIFCSPLOWO2_02_FULL_61_13]